MPAIERVIPLVGYLPASIREAWCAGCANLPDSALIALTGVAAAALMTWSVQDPSLSHATARPIRNIVGYPGAISADLLMQILGLGAIMLIVPVAAWGWRMLTHRNLDRRALRFGSWILCTVIAAGFASCWPRNGAWPLPTGLGGVVGDAVVRVPAVVFGPPGIAYSLILGTILCAAMVATFLVACGMGSRPVEEELTPIEDDDALFVEEDDRGSVSLGWVVHAAMSAKVRLTWLMNGLPLVGRQRPEATASPFERQEPNLSGRSAPPSRPALTRISMTKRRTRHPPCPTQKGRRRATPRKSAERYELPGIGADRAKGHRSPAAQQDRTRFQFACARRRAGRFGVRGEIVKIRPGPVVTLYELAPAPGIKSARVIALADDIARKMSAL